MDSAPAIGMANRGCVAELVSPCLGRYALLHHADRRIARVPEDSEQVDLFMSRLTSPLDEVAARLRALIRELVPEATESIKWRNLHYELNGGLCMVATARGYLRLEFFKGSSLPDPQRILEGSGKAGGRHVKIADLDTVGRKEVRNLIAAAVRLNTSG